MSELKSRPIAGSSQPRVAAESRQSGRLLLALVLLLVAIGALLVMDRQFWFGSDQLILDSDGTQPAIAPAATARTATLPKSANALVAKKHIAVATSSAPKTTDSSIVATNRTVLPPLDVEIVAGDAHHTIHPAGNAAKVAISHSESIPSFTAVTNAVEREGISTTSAQPQTYPLLAQHMNVQGSVVLEAIIGADGVIQGLHLVSGPAILAAAAQQAVREWRFKPVVRNGQAVETKADIVVNFTIKVNDNSDKTTLAESRADGLLIFTR